MDALPPSAASAKRAYIPSNRAVVAAPPPPPIDVLFNRSPARAAFAHIPWTGKVEVVQPILVRPVVVVANAMQQARQFFGGIPWNGEGPAAPLTMQQDVRSVASVLAQFQWGDDQ